MEGLRYPNVRIGQYVVKQLLRAQSANLDSESGGLKGEGAEFRKTKIYIWKIYIYLPKDQSSLTPRVQA